MLARGSDGKQTCTRCGSVYEMTYTDWPAGERWKINCKVCGALLREWSGTRSYEAKLLERKAWPPEEDSS